MALKLRASLRKSAQDEQGEQQEDDGDRQELTAAPATGGVQDPAHGRGCHRHVAGAAVSC